MACHNDHRRAGVSLDRSGFTHPVEPEIENNAIAASANPGDALHRDYRQLPPLTLQQSWTPATLITTQYFRFDWRTPQSAPLVTYTTTTATTPVMAVTSTLRSKIREDMWKKLYLRL